VHPDAHASGEPKLTSTTPPPDAAGDGARKAPPSGPARPRAEADETTPEPGVREAVGGVRASFMRMIDAHVQLLRAEFGVIGREIGIIAGLVVAAIAVAILTGILLYVGGALFLGDWLFGSMGWGIIHGTLLAVAIIGFVGVDLAGGDVRRYGWGFVIGIVTTVLVALFLLSNVGNEGGEATRRWLVDSFQTEQLPFGDEWLVFLSGIVIGAVVGAIIGLIVVWRGRLGGSARTGAVVGLALVGAIVAGIWLPTRYEAADGVLGLAIALGFVAWIVAGLMLAARAGFDPEGRYAKLVPRESIAAFEVTKTFLTEQWNRQKDRMMGR
jgi:hypothetical protein